MGTAVRDFSSLMSPFPTPVLVAHAPGRAGLAFPCTSGRATERTINGKGPHRSIAASALVSFPRPEGDEYGRSRRIQRPPIAVVEGQSLGVRLEIVMACDLVVATDLPAPSFRVLQAAPTTRCEPPAWPEWRPRSTCQSPPCLSTTRTELWAANGG